jgi:hypothetical protein
MTHLGRSVAALAAAGAITATALSAPTAQADQATTTRTHRHESGLTLSSPKKYVGVQVYEGRKRDWVYFNAAVYLKSPRHAFEIDVTRRHWDEKLHAVAHAGRDHWRIPTKYLHGWKGLRKALVLTWRKPDGTMLGRTRQDLCLNDWQESRLRPHAATETAYTYGCGTNPFTRGQRWGIDSGWARAITPYQAIPGKKITGDKAIVDISLRPGLAHVLGMSAEQSTVRFHATIKRYGDDGDEAVKRTSAPTGPHNESATASQAHPLEPADVSARAARIPRGTLPDLIPLPAWGIATHHEGKLDLLDFAATVYNGGRGPLVAEGFRKGSKKVMRAYQFFYRGDRQVGSARVGTMKYDKRPSHRHWHFEDFAVYDLVKSRTKKRALRTSGKEAFCLAPTDSIDLLVPNAPADPGNGDLATACGDLSSIWVREVLANGWGDTYTQYRAGQSIDITGLRNGTYWIRLRANPDGVLHESNGSNNTSFRRVILGGTPGARTVKVPKLGLVDSERHNYFGEE